HRSRSRATTAHAGSGSEHFSRDFVRRVCPRAMRFMNDAGRWNRGPADVRRAHPCGDETTPEKYAMKRFLLSVFHVQPSPAPTCRVRLALEALDERSLCSALVTDTLAPPTSGGTDTFLGVEIPAVQKVRESAARSKCSDTLFRLN